MLIKSLKSGNHYQFITLFVVCATGRSCLLFNNIVPFDNKDSAKKKHRQEEQSERQKQKKQNIEL